MDLAVIDEVIRVFISSKRAEFERERSAMAEMISSLPLLAPIIAEEWSPARENAKQKYLGDVRNSPIYVGIFGCVYSAATELEYRTALENPYREILIYVRDCENPDAELKPLLKSWFVDCEHTVRRYTKWEELRPVFQKHLWDAVGRMIEAYLQLARPEMTPRGFDSVLEPRWKEARNQIMSLGLPGDLSAKGAQAWADKLSAAYR
jgi:hypothetical protein